MVGLMGIPPESAGGRVKLGGHFLALPEPMGRYDTKKFLRTESTKARNGSDDPYFQRHLAGYR